jgi:hypothetical protein
VNKRGTTLSPFAEFLRHTNPKNMRIAHHKRSSTKEMDLPTMCPLIYKDSLLNNKKNYRVNQEKNAKRISHISKDDKRKYHLYVTRPKSTEREVPNHPNYMAPLSLKVPLTIKSHQNAYNIKNDMTSNVKVMKQHFSESKYCTQRK